MKPREAFRAAYMLQLARQHAAKPETYAWPITELAMIVDKMMAALAKGSANIDSPAIKAACKACHFKPSIGRIREFLTREEWPVA